MMISVQVFTRGDVLIDQIPDVIDPKFQESLDGAGAGSMRVPVDSAAVTRSPTVLDFGNIVRMTVNGYTFAWLIEQKTRTLIGASESEAVWEISGRGALALLADAIVYPDLVDAQARYLPIGTDRWFTPGAPDTGWNDDGLWSTPSAVVWAADDVAERVNHPANWPDEAASWIWITDPTADAAAEGVWFRTTLTTSVTERFDLYATADDSYSLFVDGQLLMTGSSAQQFQTMRITLGAGEHTFAILGKNGEGGQADANPAGVLMTLIEVDTVEHEVRLHTSSAWRCVSYDNADPLPGYNAGEVMGDLLAEATARGVDAAAAITVTWDATTDSAGDAWPTRKVDRGFKVGQDLLYVATQLGEQMCYVSMSSALELSIRSVDSGDDLTVGDAPVVLRPAHNVIEQIYRADGSGIKSAVLSLRDAVISDDDEPSITATYGRRESFLQIGNVYSSAQAAALAAWIFDVRDGPSEQITVQIRDVPGASPLVDFGVGDYVLAPDVDGALVSYRVAAISVAVDEAGNPIFVPELNTIIVDREQRMTRWQESMQNGTLGGGVTSAAPTHERYVQSGYSPATANTTRYDQSTATGPSGSPYVFYLERYPIEFSETIYRNGLMQRPGVDYYRVGKVVSMVEVIDAADEMAGHYAWNIIQPAVVENQIAAGVTLPYYLSGVGYSYTQNWLLGVHMSSNGRFQVLSCKDVDNVPHAYLSLDGLTWQDIGYGSGEYNGQGSFVVGDDGKVTQMTPRIGGHGYYLEKSLTGDWSGYSDWIPVSGATGGMVWVMASGSETVLIEKSGSSGSYTDPFTTDAWNTRQELTGNGGPGSSNTGYVLTGQQHPIEYGGFWHVGYDWSADTPGHYWRVDVTTGMEVAPSTPPTLTGLPNVLFLPHTSGLYCAAWASGTISWWKSTDAGDTWTSLGSLAAPASTFVGLTIGSDDKLHAWSYTAASGTVSIKEQSRALDGTGSWTGAATVATHEGTALHSATRGYPADGSTTMNPKYAVLAITNGGTQDLWVVNET